MKLLFVFVVAIALCVYESVSFPKGNDGSTGRPEEEVQLRAFGEPLAIQRLLRFFPVRVLKIILEDQERKVGTSEQPPEAETEAAVTEEEWGELELNTTQWQPYKSLLVVPSRCKDGQVQVGEKCREVFN